MLGQRIQIDSNGIPDHSAWALTGSTSTITEQSNSFRVPTVPVLLSMEQSTDANQGAVGYATNGVAIFGPYNSGCCDATFNEIQTMDYWNGIWNNIGGCLLTLGPSVSKNPLKKPWTSSKWKIPLSLLFESNFSIWWLPYVVPAWCCLKYCWCHARWFPPIWSYAVFFAIRRKNLSSTRTGFENFRPKSNYLKSSLFLETISEPE